MAWNLLIIPIVALLRAIFGWVENAFADGVITLPEWKKFGETILRMAVPIFGLMYGFNLDPATASGIGIFIDWIVVKLYSAIKKRK